MTRKDHPWSFLAILGQRLAEVRRGKGMTQQQVSEATDLDYTYIGFIENGKRNPTIGNVYKIAKALNISLEELFKRLRE